jgi:hypothetical protein
VKNILDKERGGTPKIKNIPKRAYHKGNKKKSST